MGSFSVRFVHVLFITFTSAFPLARQSALGTEVGGVEVDDSPLASWSLVDMSRGAEEEADGSAQRPFSTVQLCAEHVRRSQGLRGCLLRSGVYRESVNVDGWTENHPLTFRSYPGERATMSGTVKLPGSVWTRYKGDIYQMSLEPSFIQQFKEPFQQLFVNGVYMSEARYPNAGLDDMLEKTSWAQTKSGSVYGKGRMMHIMCPDNGASEGKLKRRTMR